MRRRFRFLPGAAAAALAAALPAAAECQAAPAPCDPDDGGINLPDGFCAVVFADGLGRPRHIAASPGGDLFVAVAATREDPGGVIALRDSDGDGRADVRERFGERGGTGIALAPGYLYLGTDEAVLRYPLEPGSLTPSGPPDTIVAGLPVGGHRAKSIALDGEGGLFVNIGSRSNACQLQDRQAGSPGMDPCTELETRAGIWRFDANRTGQTQADGERWATGIRNAVAIAWNPGHRALYAAQHGRDQLHQNWPDLFDQEAGAELPSEEFLRVDRGDDFGWPYCYHDWRQGRRVLAPEYGGDGERVGRCDAFEEPLLAFPGHWAPEAIAFYEADLFPARYRGGAFLSFHGSWNRAPLPQQGYNVVFIPFGDGRPTGDYEIFADGFPGEEVSPRGAEHRPMGLAVAPDGALYISDDAGGRIWRVIAAPRASP